MHNKFPLGIARTNLGLFELLSCTWAVKMGMRAQLKARSENVDVLPASFQAVTGEQIIEESVVAINLQAKVSLDSGRICGFEAFGVPRIGHLKIPPSVFIQAIESSGLVREFDWMVLTEGLKLASGLGAGARTPISFNVSPVTICEHGFAERLTEALKDQKCNGDGVKIEVLEKMPLNYLQRMQMRFEMEKAAANGIHFSIDDFGTGDANCSMLSLPVTEMKIDAFYVKKLGTPSGDHWVNSMVKLAKSKGIKTVAEGVEHQWQAESLAEKGVDIGQGFLWSRPKLALEAWSDAAAFGESSIPGTEVVAKIAIARQLVDSLNSRLLRKKPVSSY